MDELQDNYKKGLQNYIRLQEVLIEEINVDIERNKEDIRFEELKKRLNEYRLEIEEKSLLLAQQRLEDAELEEEN